MREIEIDWACSHDATDDESMIMGLLEAGGDEGPLIILPWSSHPGRSNRSDEVEVFENALHYVAHLAMHEADGPGERFVGLVRGEDRKNGDEALAALLHLKRTLVRRPSSPRGRRKRTGAESGRWAYTGVPGFTGPLRIVHAGEYAEDVRRAWSGLADGVVEVGGWDVGTRSGRQE